MCLAVPMKLTKIDGTAGVVEQAGISTTVGLELIENPQVGDYLIVHAGFAISRLDAAEAQQTLDLFRQLAETDRQ